MKAEDLTPLSNPHWHLGANYPNETTRGVVICYDNLSGACHSITSDIEESMRGVNAPLSQISGIKERIRDDLFFQGHEGVEANQGYSVTIAGLIYWIAWIHIPRAGCPYRHNNEGTPNLIDDSRKLQNDYLVEVESHVSGGVSPPEKEMILQVCLRARLDAASAGRFIEAFRHTYGSRPGIPSIRNGYNRLR